MNSNEAMNTQEFQAVNAGSLLSGHPSDNLLLSALGKRSAVIQSVLNAGQVFKENMAFDRAVQNLAENSAAQFFDDYPPDTIQERRDVQRLFEGTALALAGLFKKENVLFGGVTWHPVHIADVEARKRAVAADVCYEESNIARQNESNPMDTIGSLIQAYELKVTDDSAQKCDDLKVVRNLASVYLYEASIAYGKEFLGMDEAAILELFEKNSTFDLAERNLNQPNTQEGKFIYFIELQAQLLWMVGSKLGRGMVEANTDPKLGRTRVDASNDWKLAPYKTLIQDAHRPENFLDLNRSGHENAVIWCAIDLDQFLSQLVYVNRESIKESLMIA